MEFPKEKESNQPILKILPSGMGFLLHERQLAQVERWGWCWLTETDFVAARDVGAVYDIAFRFDAKTVFEE
jgi:hypothetical protein